VSSRQAPGVDLLGSPVRRQVVDLLANLPTLLDPETGARRSADGLSAGELADRFGLHVTTMRFHLDQLVEAGLVTSRFQRGSGAGRPRKVYSIAHGSLDAVSPERSFALLSEILVESLGTDDAHLPPEELAARWSRRRVRRERLESGAREPSTTAGQWLGKIGVMVDVLEEWGYVPEVSTTEGGRLARVALHGCPFIELARRNTALICGIHRGLVRGVLDELGEEGATISLTPFVTSHLCIADITAREPFTAMTSSPAHEKETRP
jgi:predicted ArsR family transcriptional regulator